MIKTILLAVVGVIVLALSLMGVLFLVFIFDVITDINAPKCRDCKAFKDGYCFKRERVVEPTDEICEIFTIYE